MVTIKIAISIFVIAFSSWLAGARPALAGFIIALPISSMLAIAFTQAEWKDPEKSILFAKSILVSVPLSLTFFIPFLFARQLGWPFPVTYASGIALLALSYFAHRVIFGA